MCSVSNWKSLDKKRFCFKPGLQIWNMYFHLLFPFQGYIQRGNIYIAIITWKIPHHEITLHYIRSQNFWTSSVSQCYCFPLSDVWLFELMVATGQEKAAKQTIWMAYQIVEIIYSPIQTVCLSEISTHLFEIFSHPFKRLTKPFK